MLEEMNVCFGKNIIPQVEVGNILLRKNKSTLIINKLKGQQERGVHSQFL
jgi:hypothetical protein